MVLNVNYDSILHSAYPWRFLHDLGEGIDPNLYISPNLGFCSFGYLNAYCSFGKQVFIKVKGL